MTTIGTVTITEEALVVDGRQMSLYAAISGDAAAPVFTWTPPAGASLAGPQVGQRLQWPFVAATDTGVWRVEVSDPAATDSPKTANVHLSVVRIRTMFGRMYAKHNPGPPGPDTWILAGSGGVPHGFGPDIQRVTLDATAAALVQAGMPVMMKATGAVDRARADDIQATIAVGVVVDGGRPGDEIGITTDGQVTRVDWSAITATAKLVPGARYFLSPTNAGRLVLDPPQLPGQFVAPIGRAVSDSTLEVEIQPTILN